MNAVRKKRVPSFWWDYRHHKDGTMDIVIECDDELYPYITTAPTIDAACRIIEALDAGRLDYRRTSITNGFAKS